MPKPKDPDARVPVSIRLRPSLVAKLDKAQPDWRRQLEVHAEEMAEGRASRAMVIGPRDELKPLEQPVVNSAPSAPTPKAQKAKVAVVKSGPLKADAMGVQIGPSRADFGSRLKKR